MEIAPLDSSSQKSVLSPKVTVCNKKVMSPYIRVENVILSFILSSTCLMQFPILKIINLSPLIPLECLLPFETAMMEIKYYSVVTID